jgi:hypothetical protein
MVGLRAQPHKKSKPVMATNARLIASIPRSRICTHHGVLALSTAVAVRLIAFVIWYSLDLVARRVLLQARPNDATLIAALWMARCMTGALGRNALKPVALANGSATVRSRLLIVEDIHQANY